MAEREGFEPPIRLPVCRISSAVLSTTQPPLRMPAFGEHPAHTMLPWDAQARPRNPVSRTRGYSGTVNSGLPFRLTGGGRPLYSPPHAAKFCGPCGGIGRRARLKIEFRKECWFESGQGHHAISKNPYFIVPDISAYGTVQGDCVREDFWLIVTARSGDETEIRERERSCRTVRS